MAGAEIPLPIRLSTVVQEGENVRMISAWHLVWILPLSALAGVFFNGIADSE